MAQPKYSGHNVRIVNDSPVSNMAKLMIGDELIPFISADIHLEVGEYATITAKVHASSIDIVALQDQTRVKVIRNTGK